MEQTPKGATWGEIAVLLKELEEERRVSAYVRLERPVRLVGLGRYSSWAIVLELYDLACPGKPIRSFNRAFGQGGSVKSAPSAVWWAVWDAHGWLDEREAAAAAQARF